MMADGARRHGACTAGEQEGTSMPDIWTKHPDIVRDLLREAGFNCGAEPRFLKPRDPAWTCTFDGPRMKGDLYIHPAGELRSEAADWAGPALALAVAAIVSRVRRRRSPGRTAG
jgi:hypothetical protein